MAKDKFIQKAMSKPGAKGGLHRSLGIPEGEKIGPKRIEAAAKRPGKVGKEARLAENMGATRRSGNRGK